MAKRDEVLFAQVLERYTTGKRVRDQQLDGWRTLDKLVSAKDWEVLEDLGMVSERWQSKPVMNFALMIISNLVSFVLANPPKFYVHLRPQARREDVSPRDLEMSQEDFQNCIEWKWDTLKMQLMTQDWIFNGAEFGVGCFTVPYDRYANDGKGDIAPANIHPSLIFPDPYAEDAEKGRFFIFANRYPIDYLKYRYGEGIDFKPDKEIEKIAEHEYFGAIPGGFIGKKESGAIVKFIRTLFGKDGQIEEDNQATIIECWWKDYTTKKIKLDDRQIKAMAENEAMMQKQPVKVEASDDHQTELDIHQIKITELRQKIDLAETADEKMYFADVAESINQHIQDHQRFIGLGLTFNDRFREYPNWRVTHISPSLPGVILYDRANPYMDGKLPYFFFKYQPKPNQFYGISAVNQIKNMQLAYNYVGGLLNDFIAIAAFPPLMNYTNTGLKDEQCEYRPRAIWNPSSSLAKPELLDLGKAPYQAVAHSQAMIHKNIETVMSVHEAIQGKAPGDVRAWRAIRALQAASSRRASLALQNMYAGLKEIAGAMISRFQQFFGYPMDIPRRVKGRVGEWKTGFIPLQFKDFSYYVDIEVESTLPQDKMEREEKAIMLHKIGVADKQFVAEIFDLPGLREASERMEAKVEQLRAAMRTRPVEQPGQGQGPAPTQGAQGGQAVRQGNIRSTNPQDVLQALVNNPQLKQTLTGVLG